MTLHCPINNRLDSLTPDDIQRVIKEQIQNDPKFRDAINEIAKNLE